MTEFINTPVTLKTQLATDMAKHVQYYPNESIALKILEVDSDREIAIAYSLGTYELLVLDSGVVVLAREFSNLEDLEKWALANGIKLAEVRPADKISLWAYINGVKVINVSELANARQSNTYHMKKEILKNYPNETVEFKAEKG